MGRIVITGAGECGVRTAFALREKGFNGEILLVGEEKHLPYERPPLSKAHPVMMKPIAAEGAYQEANIEIRRGVHVETIDRVARTITSAHGEMLVYDQLVLATGARARMFPGMENALTLRTYDDAEAILGAIASGTHIAIIGGGFIGLELAATAQAIGARVTVIEAADRLMARAVPPEIAKLVEDRHHAEGVELQLGTAVSAVVDNRVTLKDGRSIEADLIVAGVGCVPNTALAEIAGLDVANGIVVDGCFRTSDRSIFAAGDCCAFPYRGTHIRLECWRGAQDQANHIAKVMLGDDTPYAVPPWFWSDQYDLTLQVVGLSGAGMSTVRRPVGHDGFILFEFGGDGVLLAASGVGPVNAVAKDIRLAEMIIAAQGRPAPEALADPNTNLKKVLRAVSIA